MGSKVKKKWGVYILMKETEETGREKEAQGKKKMIKKEWKGAQKLLWKSMSGEIKIVQMYYTHIHPDTHTHTHHELQFLRNMCQDRM